MTNNDHETAILTMRDKGVLRITIRRPEKKNALTLKMYDTLTRTFEQAAVDDEIRVLLLHGAGDCFTAGNDLQDFLSSPTMDESSPVVRFLFALSEIEKPLVAAVHGAAIGIGTTLLCHCDLVYAARSAQFQLPFVNLGLCPEAASTYLLPLLAGHQRAAELLLLGRPFSAETAYQIGLANRLFADEDLLENAIHVAHELSEKPVQSVLATKALLKKTRMPVIKETIVEEIKLFRQRLSSPEAEEALKAFFERRKPDFSKFQ